MMLVLPAKRLQKLATYHNDKGWVYDNKNMEQIWAAFVPSEFNSLVK